MVPRNSNYDCLAIARATSLLLSFVQRRVAEEVLLYLVRLLEDLELDAVNAGLSPGRVSCSLFAHTSGRYLVRRCRLLLL